MIYTGGTTGRPKGVMLDHTNLVATAAMIVDGSETTAADRCLLVLPLFHVNGIMVSVVSPLVAGGSTVIAPRYMLTRNQPYKPFGPAGAKFVLTA